MTAKVIDPLKFKEMCWPDVVFSREQIEIIYSVRDNVETVVPAGNMLGKDYVAGFIILWFFMSRHPCRIVTTSAKEDHLRVLWGEMGQFIQSSKVALDVQQGGSLIVNDRDIYKVVNSKKDKLSYIIGRVASPDKIAAMSGHHIAQTGDGIPRTLFVPDECSSIPQAYYTMAIAWFNRMLAIGNPWPCDNFFKYAVKGEPGTKDKGGNIRSSSNGHYDRKVIQITAQDSPNVRLAETQIKNGKKPTHEILIPGLKPYAEYLRNRERWNPIEQCVGLDAEWYEGPEIKLFPPDWVNAAELAAFKLPTRRKAKAIGVDTAYGGDNTSWCAVDELGVIAMHSKKTPDTSIIVKETLIFMRDMLLNNPRQVLFDSGGGGQVHVDYLRARGYNVRSIAFGGSATPEKEIGIKLLADRKEEDEVRYIYKNRRAEMYWAVRLQIDPLNEAGFGIPAEILDMPRFDGKATLREQLVAVPLDYSEDGRLFIIPKTKKATDPDTKLCLTDIIGCSPDELDSLVLAVFGLVNREQQHTVKALA